MTLQELNMVRRSVHFFDKEKGLDMNVVKRVISEATLAPSAYNLQPWRIIMVKSDESKQKLYNLAFKQAKILEAPLTLIIIGDKEGYEENNSAWNEIRESYGNDAANKMIDGARNLYGSSEEAKIKFAESNTSLFAMNLMLLFKAYGIDTHAMSGMSFEKIKAEFNLQKSEDVVMLVAIGYKDSSKQLSPRRKRKNYSEIVTEI